MSGVDWRFDYCVMSELPPLAWVARVVAPLVEVRCGASVRRSASAFIDGTWSGTTDLDHLANCATIFGSGMAIADGDLTIVPPSHTHDAVYATDADETLLVSNSVVALLAAAGAELEPSAPYPARMCRIAHIKVATEDPRTGLLPDTFFAIPARPNPIVVMLYENMRVDARGQMAQVRKPRERPFRSFDDYRQRLFDATRSVFANAQTYEPVVALSAGYDSTAVAAVAARFDCQRALTLTSGRSFIDGSTVPDGGAAIARNLGLACESFDRKAYLKRTDLPEAEFLASGMSGEDVSFAAFEPRLRRTTLLTGFWEGDLWVKSRGYPQPHAPGDFSGCNLSEFRLRTDFIHVPLPCFGTFQSRAGHPFIADADMRPFAIGGEYDRAIPRRLAEEAGLARGTFARSKQAATVLLHREGRPAFAPATVAAIESFASAHDFPATFALQPRTTRTRRGLIRAAYAVHVPRLVGRYEQQRRMAVTFEPKFGALLFRWAVSVVRPRYRALEPATEVEAAA